MSGIELYGRAANNVQDALLIGSEREALISHLHARYQRAVLGGKVYYAAMQAGASLGTALTATAVTLTLYNPLASGVNLVLLHTSVAITTVPVGAGTAVYVYAANVNPLAASPSATTDAVVRNCFLGGAAGIGKAFTAATLPAAPVVARVVPGGIYWATAAGASSPMVFNDWVDGSLILAPNTAVTIQGIGVATSGIVALAWEETPV